MARHKEQKLYDRFKDRATGRLLFHRIENLMMNGMSDMIVQNKKGVTAWVENKAIEAWPVRANTVALRNAFQRGQLSFLREWIGWNGHAYVLLRVGQGVKAQYLLLNPMEPLDLLSRNQLETRAAVVQGMEEIVSFLEGIAA
jgi:hypothetical protein|nr:MAG TPA: hypothetical protein [Caudoviricetes sp.]